MSIVMLNSTCGGDKQQQHGVVDHVTRLFARQNLNEVRIPLEKANALPPEERSYAFHDLHGVADHVQEDPETISRLLSEMDHQIASVPEHDAYTTAFSHSPEYVQGLRLRFLRKTDYKPLEAAESLALHFDLRQRFFGTDQLYRELTENDLKEEDIPYFKTGGVRLLQRRDRSGRAILVTFAGQSNYTPIDTLIRLFLLYGQYTTISEEKQKKGIIFIYFGIGQSRQYGGGRVQMVAQGLKGSSMRIAAIHACYDNPLLHSVMSLGAYALESRTLIRFKCHYGSAWECIYSLMTYGIPLGTLPLKPDGSVDLKQEIHFVSTVKDLLDVRSGTPDSAESDHILEPSPMDVLVGRGQAGTKSLGNQRLKKLLEEYHARYEAGSRFDKIVIGQTIFSKLKESGSRFLTRSKEMGGWEIVCEASAKDTISHGFRNLRRMAKEKRKMKE